MLDLERDGRVKIECDEYGYRGGRMELRKVVFGHQDIERLALNKWLSKET